MEYSDIKSAADFWEWAREHRPGGLKLKQIAFAEYRFSGDAPVRAAERAGYKVGPGLPVTASRLNTNEQVRELIQQCAAIVDPSEIADADEVLKILTHEARHGSGQSKIRAADLLGRYHESLKGNGREASWPDLLESLCEQDKLLPVPLFTAAAVALARSEASEESRAWQPSEQALFRLRQYPELMGMIDEPARDTPAGAAAEGAGAASRLNGCAVGPSRAAESA